jgi:general stress protein 26
MKHMSKTSNWAGFLMTRNVLAAACAMAVMPGAAFAATASLASTWAPTQTHALAMHTQDKVTGLTAIDQPLHIAVALKLRDRDQLDAFVAARRQLAATGAQLAAPMTAQLDRDAHHAIWFFTTRDSQFARGGAAAATFASRGHDVFARFAGTLAEETDPRLLDQHWSSFVESWFPGGQSDPALLFLRMDLGEATIWTGKLGLLDSAKMMLGLNVSSAIEGRKATTQL